MDTVASVTCSEDGCEATKLKARGLCAVHYTPAKRYPAQSLKPPEFKRLLAAADGPRWTNKRDVALMQLLAHSGLRIDEALSLTPDDIDWDREPRVTLFVAHGKGDKSRIVSLRREALPAVKAWLAIRPGVTMAHSDPLFPSGSGRKLDASQVRRLFRRLGKKAGISKRVHPHGLRHTFTVNASHDHVEPAMLQRQLGHSSLATTTRYLSTVSAEDVQDAFDEADRRNE